MTRRRYPKSPTKASGRAQWLTALTQMPVARLQNGEALRFAALCGVPADKAQHDINETLLRGSLV